MPAWSIGLLAPIPLFVLALKYRLRNLWLFTSLYGIVWISAWMAVGATGQDSAPSNVGAVAFAVLAGVCAAHACVLRDSLPRKLTYGGSERALPAVELPAEAGGARLNAPDQLRRALAAMSAFVHAHAASFPPSCREALDEMSTRMGQVISFVAGGGHADAQLRLVQAMLTDYLPTSINTFLRLPRDYAVSHRNPDGRTAVDELEAQLRLLSTAAQQAAAALYGDDALRLQAQSTFLQDKFGESELDLP